MPWMALSGGALAISTAWYWVEYGRTEPLQLPGGSSFVGFWIGVVVGLIFLFEFLYWPRRWPQVRTWRIGRAETWLRAHLWFGLITLPMALLHSGFTTGGTFTTTFFAVFLIVYASGLFGLAMQRIIPRLLLNEIPEETIHSEIPAVMLQHLRDAERLVANVTGEEHLYAGRAESLDPETVSLGSPRQLGTIRQRAPYRQFSHETIPHTEALSEALRSEIRPFLTSPKAPSRLKSPGQAGEYFDELRRHLPPAAHPATNHLEAICKKQRQLRRQQRFFFWLHSWLSIHLPLSVALIIMLLVHIVTALRYSGNPF